MTPDWQRARTEEAIAERRTQILDAARECFTAGSYESTTLNGIARKAAMAKANIYRYFKTREEIFLAIVLEEMRAWVGDLVPAISRSKSVARTLALSFTGNPRFMELLVRLAGAIEANVSENALAGFKREVLPLMARAGKALGRALPGVPEKEVFALQLQTAHMAIGAWPSIKPDKIRDKVLSRAEFAPYKVDHEEMLIDGFQKLIDGCVRRGKPRK